MGEALPPLTDRVLGRETIRESFGNGTEFGCAEQKHYRLPFIIRNKSMGTHDSLRCQRPLSSPKERSQLNIILG